MNFLDMKTPVWHSKNDNKKAPFPEILYQKMEL